MTLNTISLRSQIINDSQIAFYILFYCGVQLMNNILLVSGVQQSDSVIHIYVSIVFQILFPFRLLHNIEQSSLCVAKDLVTYAFQIQQCIRVHPKLPSYSSPPQPIFCLPASTHLPPPPVTISLSTKSVNLFLFCK